jgi:hypothetical protein
MQENAADEAEIASMKKDINDALGSDYHDQMQALDNRFSELSLGTPVQKDYALMRDATAMLQKEKLASNLRGISVLKVADLSRRPNVIHSWFQLHQI